MSLSGCRADVTTTIELARDGSGVVSVALVLDRAAVTALRGQGALTSLIGGDDLRARGWQVVGPVPKPPGGFVEYRADRPVSNATEATAAVAEVSAVLGGLDIARSTSLGTVRLRVSGDIDLTGGVEALAGDDVLQRTFGSRLGAPLAELEQELGGPIAERTSLTLDVRIPDGATRIPVPFGERTTVDVVSVERDVRSWVAALIGLAGLVLAAVLTAATIRAKRRARARAGIG